MNEYNLCNKPFVCWMILQQIIYTVLDVLKESKNRGPRFLKIFKFWPFDWMLYLAYPPVSDHDGCFFTMQKTYCNYCLRCIKCIIFQIKHLDAIKVKQNISTAWEHHVEKQTMCLIVWFCLQSHQYNLNHLNTWMPWSQNHAISAVYYMIWIFS